MACRPAACSLCHACLACHNSACQLSAYKLASSCAPYLQVSAGAMLPITAVQFGMNRALEQTYRRVTGADKLTTGGTVAVALGAGAASAFLGCPAE